MDSEKEKLVYSVSEIAEVLGLSRNHAYTMVHSGKIPVLRFGKRLLVPKKAITMLLESGFDVSKMSNEQ